MQEVDERKGWPNYNFIMVSLNSGGFLCPTLSFVIGSNTEIGSVDGVDIQVYDLKLLRVFREDNSSIVCWTSSGVYAAVDTSFWEIQFRSS